VIAGQSASLSDEEDTAANASLDVWLSALLAELPLKSAVAVVVKATGLSKNVVYQRALALKKGEE
jgi:16S rRNA (cytidine1402-2'-O)-methyltransferase